jgi:hypothetical protein
VIVSSTAAKNFIPAAVKPDVTDHAVLRYLERAKGFDIEAVRQEIAQIVAPAVAVGATAFSANGLTFPLVGNRVVTVLDAEQPTRTARRDPGAPRVISRNDIEASRRKRRDR